MRWLARFRRWQVERHTRQLAEQYAPRLTAMRAFVGEKKQAKVVYMNLVHSRGERHRRRA